MSLKFEQKIEDSISKTVLDLGFEIEYVEFVKEGGNNILRVVIDKPNSSVSIDDCETVSRAVEETIDESMKNDNEYVLEVSSPGLERQLKNTKLFNKYMNKEVYVKVFKKINNIKEFTGKLVSLDESENKIIIQKGDESVEIEMSNISSAHTVFDFDKLLNAKEDVE